MSASSHVRRVILFTVSVVLVCASASVASDAGNLSDTLHALCNTSVERNHLPSLVVAVVQDQKVIYADAFGLADIESGTVAALETVYPVASLTKLFVATAFISLVEDGKLRFDDHVVQHVPEYKVRAYGKSMRPTTLWQLATHASGLPSDPPCEFWADHSWTSWILSGGAVPPRASPAKEDVLSSLDDLQVEHPPNSLYGHYSNLGYKLLGITLETVSKRAFADVIEERVLHPLKMTRSYIPAAGDSPSEIAAGYVLLDGQMRLRVPSRRWQSDVYSGGLHSTVGDMARFVSSQFQDGSTVDEMVISPDNLRLAHWAPFSWAFQFDPQNPAIEHSGGIVGYASHVAIIPDLKLGVIAMINTFNPLTPANPCRDIARALLRTAKGYLHHGAASPVAASAPFTPSNYAGIYSLAGGDAHVRIDTAAGALVYQLVEDTASSAFLTPLGNERFQFADDPTHMPWVSFERGDGGVAKSVRIGGYLFSRMTDNDGLE